MVFIASFASVTIVSLLSLLGIVTFKWTIKELKPFLLILVSFSAGAMLGDVFVHLFPETIDANGVFTKTSALCVLAGFTIFFILEKFIHWHHCHYPQEHERPSHLGYMNLVGDGLHNFIDGMIIGGSYLISMPVGFATTIAVILHEIPQEISDFGVLIHSGFTKSKALFFNFLSALTAILGTALVLFAFGQNYELILKMLTPFTIGGFLYIAGSDLIPELHKETNPLSSIAQLISFLAGIAVMFSLLLIGV